MTDFDASAPDPEMAASDLGELPKATIRNALRLVIVLAVVLTLTPGNICLFGESKESLHDALNLHTYDEAIRLIRRGADVNAMNTDGKLPLVLAADDPSANAYDVVRELLLHGARVNETDRRGRTALHRAADHGNMAVADLLLRHGADINATWTYETIFGEQTVTPLEEAYRQGRFRMGEFLTYRGANIPDNLEHLKRMGEGERLRERYEKLPKPENLSEEEWSEEISLRVIRKANPESARLLEDFMRMNPEAMKVLESIMKKPPPEGVDRLTWERQKFMQLQRMFQSGQFKIPELKK